MYVFHSSPQMTLLQTCIKLRNVQGFIKLENFSKYISSQSLDSCHFLQLFSAQRLHTDHHKKKCSRGATLQCSTIGAAPFVVTASRRQTHPQLHNLFVLITIKNCLPYVVIHVYFLFFLPKHSSFS
jgi:hypothetical protein